jgi:endonuclease YncB( thermonuclease family)
MMYKTNFIVLVLSAARNKVVIWDDFERKNRTEISFNNVVRNIKLRKDMLVVVLDTKTFVFSFMNLKLIENVETGANPYGICGLATAEKAISKTLVVLDNTKQDKIGRLKVLSYGK